MVLRCSLALDQDANCPIVVDIGTVNLTRETLEPLQDHLLADHANGLVDSVLNSPLAPVGLGKSRGNISSLAGGDELGDLRGQRDELIALRGRSRLAAHLDNRSI